MTIRRLLSEAFFKKPPRWRLDESSTPPLPSNMTATNPACVARAYISTTRLRRGSKIQTTPWLAFASHAGLAMVKGTSVFPAPVGAEYTSRGARGPLACRGGLVVAAPPPSTQWQGYLSPTIARNAARHSTNPGHGLAVLNPRSDRSAVRTSSLKTEPRKRSSYSE
eukprot:7391747-Prymnesium_polylepis.1